MNEKKIYKHKHKSTKKQLVRKRSNSSSSSSSTSSSSGSKKHSKPTIYKKRKVKAPASSDTSSSSDDAISKYRKINLHKAKDRKEKAKCKKKKCKKPHGEAKRSQSSDENASMDVPIMLMDQAAKSMAPMSKEQWEKQQSVMKKVYDESTGRHRLIKGDGEVIEEIVSKDRHKKINQQATSGDGNYFQKQLGDPKINK